MTKFFVFFASVALVLLGIFGFALVMAYPTKWLVNYIFTDSVRLALFGVAQISLWRAFLLGLLCAGLFKGSCSCKESK